MAESAVANSSRSPLQPADQSNRDVFQGWEASFFRRDVDFMRHLTVPSLLMGTASQRGIGCGLETLRQPVPL